MFKIKIQYNTIHLLWILIRCKLIRYLYWWGCTVAIINGDFTPKYDIY